LETRHDLKTRTEEYRNWQRGFAPKKQAVMVGKTLDEFNATLPKTANLNDPDSEIDDEAMRRGANWNCLASKIYLIKSYLLLSL
jgi:hypothetical protein